MFVGTADDLGDTTDARWAQDEINKNGTALVHYQEIPAGHSSFLIGKDMAYFDTVMNLVAEFNPLPQEQPLVQAIEEEIPQKELLKEQATEVIE